jgi:hypothetical protein
MSNSRDSGSGTDNLPTQDEIEKRAYDLYLKDGEVYSTSEYWLIAEEGLKKERATADAKLTKWHLSQIALGDE